MTIAGMGAVAATKGQFEHAAQLFGAAEALTEHRDAFTYVEIGVIFERMLAEARAWLRDG